MNANSRRIVRLLERRGLLIADPDHPYLDLVPGSSLDHLRAASVAYRIAIGPHAGRKALTLYSVPPLEEASRIPLLAKMAGFSLHAATVCEAHQRSHLERLCRYITRPPMLRGASPARTPGTNVQLVLISRGRSEKYP